MICISVTPESRQLAKVDLLNASRSCDLVELCLDHLIKESDVSVLLAGVTKPVLVSCRRPQDGGHFKGTEEERMALLRQTVVAGPAYIELDLEVAKKIPRFGDTKRVISYTSLNEPLGNVDAIFDDARKADADVVKFTWPTPTLEAAWPLLTAVTKKRDLPVVGMGLGRPGVTFSLLGRRYDSPWIYAALEPGMETHEGQATVWELDEVYDWRAIGPGTKLIGVVGFGESETMLVRVFNAGFQKLKMNTRCLPMWLTGFDKLEAMLDVLRINALAVNPAVAPQILKFAKHAEEAAEKSEYADLLLKQDDGWNAYTMIWRSNLIAIEKALPLESGEERPLDRRNVMIIGSKSMAQAVAYGINRRNGIHSVTSPQEKQAKKVAKMFGSRHVPFPSLYDTLADVVVITDPAIVAGYKKTELNPSYFRPNMAVSDVCHLPHESALLHEARQRGAKIIEPTEIFTEQASVLFNSIIGQPLPEGVINEVLAAES